MMDVYRYTVRFSNIENIDICLIRYFDMICSHDLNCILLDILILLQLKTEQNLDGYISKKYKLC